MMVISKVISVFSRVHLIFTLPAASASEVTT